MWLVLLPGLTVTVITGGVVAYLATSNPRISDPITITILSVAFVVCMVVILTAVFRARAVARDVDDGIRAVRSGLVSGERELQQLMDQWQRGERLQYSNPVAGPRAAGQFHGLATEVYRLRRLATTAVVDTAGSAPAAAATPPHSAPQQQPASRPPAPAAEHQPLSSEVDHRVGVFVNLARRLQSLVHREIQLLDDLEAQVEDPDLLKGLFSVDHLATRIRRHAENLAVLGGAVSRRQWSRPVNIYAVLRSAVAEVEQYSRVKLVRPFEGHLQGHVVADVVHLVAELVENATQFSAPQTEVLLRAEHVTAGLAVEVEDRGLGIPRDEKARLNDMLAGTDMVNVDDLLRDGRIGLFVVATLARRHGIAAQLQSNIYGGIQAVIVLPRNLLGDEPQDEYKRQPPPPSEETTPPPAPEPAPEPEPVTQSAPLAPEPLTPAVFEEPVTNTEQRRPSPDRKPRPVAGNGSGSGHVVVPVARTPDYRVSSSQATESMAPSADDIEVSFEAASLPGNAPISSAMSTEDVPTGDGDDAARPRLPQRRKQAHLAPQLADLPPATDDNAPVQNHDPGLMASFQRGFNRADDVPDETPGGYSGSPHGAN